MVKRGEKNICSGCNKLKEIHFVREGNPYCNWCYRKNFWKRKMLICKRCKRPTPLHAKGLCAGCYNSTFHIDKVKIHNAKRRYNITSELYKKLIQGCAICNFNSVIDLHHLDHNKKNNTEENLVGLCPNHHKMIHMKKYQGEIFTILKEKGFKIPNEGYTSDGFFQIKRS